MPSAYAPAVGGVEELTFRLAQRYLAAGDEVEVWTNRHPLDLPGDETLEDIRVRRFRLVLPRLALRQLVRFPRAARSALRDLERAVAEFRPDVVHVQCFSVNGVYAALLSRRMNLPLVVSLQGETVMDDHDVYEKSFAMRVGLRMGLRTASEVTGCSEFVLNDARTRFGLPVGRGCVVPNGVETEEVAVESADIPFERFVFAVGRVVEKKGFDLLIDAFARIARDHPEVGLVIAGEGSARDFLIECARKRGLESRVWFPGRLSRSQVAWAMRHARVFVLPSRVEPFGIVVIEAMAAGCPVIVSARGGAPEIVRDGDSGLVVDPFDTQALGDAIGGLLRDGSRARRLGESARHRAQDFTWQDISGRYRDIYARVAGKERARG